VIKVVGNLKAWPKIAKSAVDYNTLLRTFDTGRFLPGTWPGLIAGLQFNSMAIRDVNSDPALLQRLASAFPVHGV